MFHFGLLAKPIHVQLGICLTVKYSRRSLFASMFAFTLMWCLDNTRIFNSCDDTESDQPGKGNKEWKVTHLTSPFVRDKYEITVYGSRDFSPLLKNFRSLTLLLRYMLGNRTDNNRNVCECCVIQVLVYRYIEFGFA